MPGSASVACGIRVLGSGAAEGTSICGCCSTLGWTRPKRTAQRAPTKTTRSTARSPITSLAPGLTAVDTWLPDPETPGMCGISVLKRSIGGWSAIKFCMDSILQICGEDNPLDSSVTCDQRLVTGAVRNLRPAKNV